MVNGVMPNLEAEVSVFDNARSLRIRSTRNRTVSNRPAVPNGSIENAIGNGERPVVHGNGVQPVVNGNSERPVVNGNGENPVVNGNSEETNVSNEDRDKDKTQNSAPKGKLQITSNIRQLYSIRRRPKMTPSDIVRATATRTRSRSPSPQQLMKAGPWPHTIVTKAVIEPEPRSCKGNTQDGKSKKVQVHSPAEPEKSVEKTSDLKIRIKTINQGDKQSHSAEGGVTQGNKTSNAREAKPTDTMDTAGVKIKDNERDNDELQENKSSANVENKDQAKHSSTEAPKVKDKGSIKTKSGSKGISEEAVKSKNTVLEKVEDGDMLREEDEEKSSGSRSMGRNAAKDQPKVENTELDNGDKVEEAEFSDDLSDLEDEAIVENVDDLSSRNTREFQADKNGDIKVTSRVSVILEDISKGKSKEVRKDIKSAQPLENTPGTEVGTTAEDEEPGMSGITTPSKMKEMEDILADMLKRQRSEEEKAKQLETSNIYNNETSQIKEGAKSDLQTKPKTQCRTKAMLLQRLRQSTSLENLSSYAKESEHGKTQSKTDDILGIGSKDSHVWRPAVNVRAFTQPVKDNAPKVSKPASPVACSAPVTKPAPVMKARARKPDSSSKGETSPDTPPIKVSKGSKSQHLQYDSDAQKVEVGKANQISVTKSKAYQDFVQGLYETKTERTKSSGKLNDILPSRRSAGVPSLDSDSSHSCTTKSSSTDSGSRSSSDKRRRSKRTRTPKYYGPDMFLIDDAMLVNYKVLKPHFEDNGYITHKRKPKRTSDLDFLQYEGEHSDDAKIKPRKSRNSKHAFTITSARKNTSAYQMKNVEVRLQKMSIDEEGHFQKTSTGEKIAEKDTPTKQVSKIPKISLFGATKNADEPKSKTARDGEKIVGKISSGLDVSTSDEDTCMTTTPAQAEDDDSIDKKASGDDEIFLTPGSSFHRSNTDPELSKSPLHFEDDRENEKENDLDAAKQLLEEEKKDKETKNDPKKGECWRGRPAELQFRSTSDLSTEPNSDDDEATVIGKYTLPLKRKSVFSTSESESECPTNSKSENELYSGTQHRRKPKHPKKAYLGNSEEQLLNAKYGAIKYGGNLAAKKKDQNMNTDSDSASGSSKHDSTASTITFPVDKDKDNASDKNLLGNSDEDVTTASDCEIVVTKKGGDNKQAITAWNDSVYQTFDKAIDLCLRSNKEAVAMSTDSDPDQESLNLQLDDLDDPLDEIKTPGVKEIKSQSDPNIHKASADDTSNFHFFSKDGSVVGRIMRENYKQRRSSSSDRLLEKNKSNPVSIISYGPFTLSKRDFNASFPVLLLGFLLLVLCFARCE